VVLVAGSVAASLGYLAELDGRHREAVLQRSARYRELRAQLDELDREISILTQAAEADTERSYRRRALDTLATVRELRSERDQVRQALASLAGTAAAAVSPGQIAQAGVLGGLARLLNLEVSRVRVVAYGVVALMLELISIAALLLASGPRPRPTAATPEPSPTEGLAPPAPASQPQVAETLVPGTVPVARAQTTVATESDTEGSMQAEPREIEPRPGIESDGRYHQARELVMTRSVSPTYRALQSALQMSQATARTFLEKMVDEGVLRRAGRFYALQSIEHSGPAPGVEDVAQMIELKAACRVRAPDTEAIDVERAMPAAATSDGCAAADVAYTFGSREVCGPSRPSVRRSHHMRSFSGREPQDLTRRSHETQ
jgi:phage shock protein PspC (stress-responsive transcriptional regulator)